MTTTQPHDKTDIAIAAVAAFAKVDPTELRYERSNLLRNLLHIRHVRSDELFIYSTHSGAIYPPARYYIPQDVPPF